MVEVWSSERNFLIGLRRLDCRMSLPIASQSALSASDSTAVSSSPCSAAQSKAEHRPRCVSIQVVVEEIKTVACSGEAVKIAQCTKVLRH